MKCSICHGNVSQEITTDMCYPKEYTCKDCGATFIKMKENLVLISEQEAVAI